MALLKFVKELIFRLKLYFLGIRFYEAKDMEHYAHVNTTSYMFDEIEVQVTFRRVKCKDLVMKRGSVFHAEYNSYVVLAQFDRIELDKIQDKEAREHLEFLHGKAFFFNGHHNRLRRKDDCNIELITDVYMDFISALIRKKI